jgi:hypothetical protein
MGAAARVRHHSHQRRRAWRDTANRRAVAGTSTIHVPPTLITWAIATTAGVAQAFTSIRAAGSPGSGPCAAATLSSRKSTAEPRATVRQQATRLALMGGADERERKGPGGVDRRRTA